MSSLLRTTNRVTELNHEDWGEGEEKRSPLFLFIVGSGGGCGVGIVVDTAIFGHVSVLGSGDRIVSCVVSHRMKFIFLSSCSAVAAGHTAALCKLLGWCRHITCHAWEYTAGAGAGGFFFFRGGALSLVSSSYAGLPVRTCFLYLRLHLLCILDRWQFCRVSHPLQSIQFLAFLHGPQWGSHNQNPPCCCVRIFTSSL